MTKQLRYLCTLLLLAVASMTWGAEGDVHDMNKNQSTLLNNSASIPSIEIEEQSYLVKCVTINWRYNKTIQDAVTIEVKVNGVSWGTKTTGGGTGTDYVDAVFTGEPSNGPIVITFTNNAGNGTGKGTFYIGSVKLTEGSSGSASQSCATPTFTPAAGTYTSAQNVSISCATEGATIHYTTDGNDPTTNSSVYYTPIEITTTTTLKALAVKAEMENSSISTAIYTIQPNKPTITINEGVISISADENLIVYYTTDGNDPLKTSNLYSEPFSPSHSCTIKAIAVDANDNLSEIASAYYVYQKNINSDYYVKVTDASTLEEGDVIIIVNDNKSYERVLGADRGNNRAAPAIANKPSGGIIDGPGEDAQRITLVPIEENWYLYTGKEGYLYAASSSSNNLKTGQISVAGDNAKAAISFSDGNATIRFQGENTRNLIRYNSSSELFSCYASGQNDVQIYKKVVKPVVVVATPTFSVEEGTYFEAQNVTISCETTGATIRYTTDGSEPTATTGTVYSEPLNISTTTTLKAIAVKGEDVSAVATATYTFPTVYSLSQMNAQTDAKDYYVKFDNAVVTYVNGKYVFIEDATGAILFFNTNTYTEKQVLNGTAKVTWKLFNGQPEATAIAAIDGVTFTTDGSVESVSPAVVTLADLSGNNKDSYISKFVTLNGVTVNEGNLVQGESSLAYYCRNGVALTEGSKYNLTGFLGIYEKDNVKTYQLYLYTTDHVVEYPAAPTFSIEGGTFNEAQTIELSCVTEGATIQYSIDNANWVTYSDPIVINETTTITAKAVKDGLESEEVSASYTLRQPGTIRLYFAHDPETNLTAHTMSCGAAVNLNYETNSNGTISIEDMSEGIKVTPKPEQGKIIVYAGTDTDFSQVGEYKFKVVVSETDSYTSTSLEFTLTVVKFKAYFDKINGFEATKDLINGTDGGQLTGSLATNTKMGDLSTLITWASTNENVATIDNEGKITLVAPGGVRFTVSYAGNEYNEACQSTTDVMTVIDTTPVAAPAKPIVFHDGGEGVTYEGELTVPMFAEEGATIYYTTDGTEPTAASTEYTKPLNISTNTTLKAIAVKDGVESDVVTREYRIEAVDAPDINLDGYYSIKNNNGNYVNVAGRKTVTFVDKNTSKTAAGTVIRVKTTNGKVEVLRSQGVDVPRYAERAMSYVPELVKEFMKRLSENVENPIIGEDGANLITDEVMDLDYNLYLEEADGGYRIYGKTPSMQRVVDFYATNKTIIDERLPRLEEFVEDVLLKVAERLDHPNSEWASKFKILDIWAKLVVTNPDLTKPEEGNAEAISKFYTEILSSEANIWNFAHETMMIYWTKVDQLINDPESQYASMLENLGDYKKYLEKVPNILPNFKYYIVSDGSGIDFISEGNEDIINDAARTVWTLEGRENFNVTFLKDNALSSGRELYTTLYTDFAYKLPDGVKAYAITGVNETTGVATKEEFPSNIIPAQTPVLLQATFDAEQTADQTKTLELTTEAGTTPETNLLVGADYLINEYKINSTQAEGVLNMLKSLSESLYNEYEYLMRKNAGTVNNKYFFGLDDADMELCVYGEDQDCVVRNLGTGENQPLAFYGDWQAPKANQAFLVSETFNPILLTQKGDVDRDGDVDYDDVKALVKIVLGEVTIENNPNDYDFDAAHVNEDKDINIADVTALVNILLP